MLIKQDAHAPGLRLSLSRSSPPGGGSLSLSRPLPLTRLLSRSRSRTASRSKPPFNTFWPPNSATAFLCRTCNMIAICTYTWHCPLCRARSAARAFSPLRLDAPPRPPRRRTFADARALQLRLPPHPSFRSQFRRRLRSPQHLHPGPSPRFQVQRTSARFLAAAPSCASSSALDSALAALHFPVPSQIQVPP